MIRIILIALSVAFSIIASAQTPPDFNYPKTSERKAQSALTKALARHDDMGAVRAVADMFLLRTAVDPDEAGQALHMVDSVAGLLTQPAAKALCLLMEADIYYRLYQDNRWRYDTRETPATPLPSSYQEWNGGQFRSVITALADSALSYSAELKKVRLSECKGLITQDALTRIYSPTLYIFALRKAIEMTADDGARIDSLYSLMERVAEPGSAVEIEARMGRISDTKELWRLYDSYISPVTGTASTEWAGDILVSLGNGYAEPGSREQKRIYDAITRFVGAWPGYERRGCMERTLMLMRQKSLRVSAPEMTGAGLSYPITAWLGNIDKGEIRIYDVSSSPVIETGYQLKKGTPLPAPVAVIPVTAEGEKVPFVKEMTLSHTFSKEGTYIIVPWFEGKPADDEYFEKIYVSRIGISRMEHPGCRNVWAIDLENGSPLEGVEIGEYTYTRNKPELSATGTTGADGEVTLPLPQGRYLLAASRGADCYARPLTAWGGGGVWDDDWHKASAGYPSLPLYHPGDTAEWVAVTYEYKYLMSRPRSGASVTAVLRSPSGVALDTLVVKADRWGRITGSFPLPKDGEQGSYSISLDGEWSAVSFMVSDYKQPTMRIVDTWVETVDSAATLRGRVETYTGFPLAGSKVRVTLNVCQWPWRRSMNRQIATADTVTDANGGFELTFDPKVLDSSPWPGGYFTAVVAATSQAGETQQTQLSFTRGSRYYVRGSVDRACDITSGRLMLRAEAVDARDSVMRDIPVEYALINSDSVSVLRGTIDNGVTMAEVGGVPSGEYTVQFTLPNGYPADTLRTQTILYRLGDKDTPVKGRLLWSPMERVDIPGTWVFATDCPTYLLVIITSGDSLVERRWVRHEGGMGTLEVNLPDGADEGSMLVTATGKYRTEVSRVDLRRTGSQRGIRITAESFRDRIKAGGTERWRLRVTDLEGRGREAAVIADLYNTALDPLATTSWSLSPRRLPAPSIGWLAPQCGATADRTAWERLAGKMPDCRGIQNPEFLTYGRSWSPARVMMYNTALMSKKVMIRGTSYDDAVVEESADMEVAMAADAGSANGSEATTAETAELRPAEIPLSFFKPTLSTDADGNVEISFTVPEANTTWGLRTVAWTDSMLTASWSRDVVAARQLMVQSRLPRFVSDGDYVELPAMVMNAADSSLTARTSVEVFNPLSGEAIASLNKDIDLPAKGTATVVIPLTVPGGVPAIGYRVRVASELYSDGEQSLVPVLPATIPVIETRPFYIEPDSARFAMELPSLGTGAVRKLQVCENALWYVVTALPGLYQGEPRTAPELARAIYAAAMSEHIVGNNPAIAEALNEWSRTDRSEGALTSLLERNAELKTVLLQSTPWSGVAESQTERMSRLSELLDAKTVERNLKSYISDLARLRSREGWKWMGQCADASEWATQSVLRSLGLLARSGALPADKELRSAIKSSLAALTEKARKDYAKYPKSDYTHYVELMSLYAGTGLGEPDATVLSATMSRIAGGWRKSGLEMRARYAMLLHAYGYPRVARQVMESMRQYEAEEIGQGVTIPALRDDIAAIAEVMHAFATIMPGEPDVDRLRQWIVMLKGSSEWGTSQTATEVVASMLTVSDRWLTPAEGCEVTFADTTLTPTPADRITGEFTIALPTLGGHLEIERRSVTPAWGAVYEIHADTVATLRDAGTDELSISKQLVADTLAAGSKMAVTLTLTVGRALDYVVITDRRAGCMEPVEQMPAPTMSDGVWLYKENRTTDTRIYIEHLPKGVYVISYDVWLQTSGRYSVGPATVQSQYAPRYTAHSAGREIEVK